MPAPARPQTHHSQLSGAQVQGLPAVDPAFTAPDFDVKAWINNILSTVPRQSETASSSTNYNTSSTPASPSLNGIKGVKSSSISGDNGDASLDASLDLLQTPALDPVLDEKDGVEESPSSSSATPSPSQQITGTITARSAATKSQTTILTQHATTHLTKLHLLAGQTSAALSSTTQDMVKLLPRLTHELDQLRQETRTLQEGIRLVRGDINTVDSNDTIQALDRLKYLDLVKTRMEATHSALREAENWRNLEAEAKDILAKGDFTRAATRLSEAERSLVVYKNTNVEGDRMTLLLSLKNQLEQEVMGKVKEALDQKDTAACQTLIKVFGLIGRQEKFQDFYISQRRVPLLEQWKRLTQALNIGLRPSGPGGAGRPGTPQIAASTDSKDFITALQTFYKDASSMLHDEFAWITSIFSDPSATIHGLVHDIFSHIDPNMQLALQQIAKSQGDEGGLPILISAFMATEAFGTRMERIVFQPLVGNQREHSGNRSRAGSLVVPEGAKEGKGNRASFIQDKNLEFKSIQDPHEWAYVLYEPFMGYQRNYGKLEGAHLRALLTTSVPAMAPYLDPVTRSRGIAKSSSHLVKIMTNTNALAFNLAEGAIARCMRLTHGFGAPGLLDGLNGFFKDIMDRYSEILTECRQRSGLQVDANGNKIAATKQNEYGSHSRQSSKYDNQLSDSAEDTDSDGWDEDVHEQDQRLFQMGCRLMVLCKQLCQRLEQLDVKTKKALRGVEEFVNMDQSHLDGGNLSVDQGSSVSGLKSATAVQPPNGSIALLQQSNLNSFRLSEILDIVKKSSLKDETTTPKDQISTETDLGLDPKPHHLFLQSHQRAVQLTKLCQRFIFDSVYIPLSRPLADLALLPCWTEGADQPGGPNDKVARRVHQSTMGGTRTDVIRFRSSPSDYMEELLRQLLALPLTFGTYEGDPGLRFGIHSLPYADRPLELQNQQDLSSSVEGGDGSGESGGGMRGQEAEQDLGVGSADNKPKPEGYEEGEGSLEDEDDLAVMHRWITSLSRAAMHTIIERLYDPNLGEFTSSPTTSSSATMASQQQQQRNRFGTPTSSSGSSSPVGGLAAKKQHYLSRLSEAGANQLSMDMGYFVDTCLGSLAIEPTASIRSLIKALRMSEAGLLMALQQMQQHQLEQQQEQESSVAAAAAAAAEAESPVLQNTGAGLGERQVASASLEPHQVSIVIPGAPVLPSVLAVGDEDIPGQIELEIVVFKWVARLKGITIPPA
ncbi:hypothetical protein BGZ96_009783 [Linnemannia gamsii]|uniref:Conserved oligomeric Golgi complex subunit 7 n=1 Tax=Linnemannia gamsii TaxID=64522 RepID=A0ABQ7JVL0_9FUNG|nr:hypothetical protein BGZ96_009783 [Linnemannia gamsii]